MFRKFQVDIFLLAHTNTFVEYCMGAHSVSGDTALVITEWNPGPNLTKVGSSPLQWTNGDGSRWRLSAGGATCRRTAAASAWKGQGSYEGAVAMRALSFKSRTQQMRCYAKCIACIVTAPCSVQLLNLVSPAAVAPPERWRHLACATYVPTTLWFSCGSKLAKYWNFDYSGKALTYDF